MSAPTSTRVAELHCCTRLHEAFRRAITLIPLFTSIFLINRIEPDEIMALLPTQGPTGSVWGDNWVRRQQPCSWINCCTELLNSAVSLSANLIMSARCWPAEALQVQMSMPCWELFWVKWFTALHFNLQPSHQSSSFLFPKGARISSVLVIHHCMTLSHVARLYFTTICGFWSNLGLGLWVQRFRA